MKKLFLFIAFFSLISSSCFAQIEFEQIKSRTQERLRVTGFFDYYPFGEYTYNDYDGVFKPFIKEFSDNARYSLEFLPVVKNYEDTVRDVAKGEADVLLGMYSETSLYEDMKFIYPAAIDNPIHLVMLPSSMKKVRSVQDLKSLKGAIHSHEHLSDFVQDKLEGFQLEYIDNSYELYAKLMRGEIDYVLTSIYFGTIETAKLGLRKQVVFSKQSLWNMPMFIGISKSSFHREYLSHMLSKMLEKPEIREKIKNHMIEIVNSIDAQYAGTVPPSFTDNEQYNTNEKDR